MATLDLYTSFRVTIDGKTVEGGSRANPYEITVTGAIKNQTKVLAEGSTWDAWSASSGDAVGDFDFLFMHSDVEVYVELTTDSNGTNGDEPYTIKMAAGIPFTLCADDSYANYTVNFGGGTLDVIDRIRVKNVTGSGSSATVTVILIT